MKGHDRHDPAACRRMFERLSDYLDGDIDPDLCDRIDRHMADCEPCIRYLDSLRRTVRLLETQPSGETAPEDVLEAAKRALRELDERL